MHVNIQTCDKLKEKLPQLHRVQKFNFYHVKWHVYKMLSRSSWPWFWIKIKRKRRKCLWSSFPNTELSFSHNGRISDRGVIFQHVWNKSVARKQSKSECLTLQWGDPGGLDCAVCFGSTCLLRRKSLCKSIQISSLWLITVGREWNVSILILSLNLSLFCAWAIDSFHLAISSSSYCNTWSNPGSPFMPAIPGVRYYKNIKMVLTYSTCTVKLALCISWNLCPHEPGAFLPVHMTTPLTHCPHLKKHADMSSITSSILPPLYPYQRGFSPDGNVSTITELITGTRPGVPTLKCNFLTKG